MEVFDRDALEASFARKFTRLLARHKRELKKLLGSPPNIANVPKSFWTRVEKETEEEVAKLLLLIFLAGAGTHGQPQRDAQEAAQTFATKRGSELAQGFTQHTRDRMEAHSKRWSDAPPTNAQLETDLNNVLGPNRASRVASTETTNAATDGGESAVKETIGFDARDKWITREDDRVCPICFPLNDTNRTAWSRQFPKGPPAHPDCRCFIKYYLRRS